MKRICLTVYTLFILYSASAQNMLKRADVECMEHWVDSIMNQLTPDERLGQLIMPIVNSTNDDAHRQIIINDLKNYHVGGLLFSKGTIMTQAKMTQYARKQAKKAPLWIALDGEWGLSMRLTDAIKYPRNGALGTIDPEIRDSLMYQYGLETARQCRLMGININFAPVLDINSNPNNPVIGNRSFGSTVWEVVPPAMSYCQGLEEGGILAVGKHFPGHGDTDTDSHQTLPRLNHDRERMLSFECAPFDCFVKGGFGGLMMAHLEVPSLDSTANLPSSLSRPIVTELLKEQMGFDGLVFTDGLAMKGVTNVPDYPVRALLAGIDVLLDPVPLKTQWNNLKKAITDGRLPQSLIDEKCRKVLRWKYVLCVGREKELDTNDLVNRINTTAAKALRDTLVAEIEKAKLRPAQPASSVIAPKDTTTREYDPTEQGLPEQESGEVISVPECSMHKKADTRFQKVDSLIVNAIERGAFPGCQVLVAHKDEIIYNKAFGWLDASHKEPNTLETVYDLASVSKAAATIPALMKAYDEHDMKFSELISKYVPELRGTDKKNLTLRQALYHETDIRDGYTFYAMTFDTTSFDKVFYSPKEVAPFTIRQDKRCWFQEGLRFDPFWISTTKDDTHTLPIAQDMWLNPLFRDSIVQKIVDLPLKKPHRYRYSCLNFVLLRKVIENVTHTPMDEYLYKKYPQFYGPGKLCFRPLENGVPLERIAPTEQDDALRHQLLRGYVHDELCAWSGGVEGNAGLFGSATQLYPVLQMFLNGGKYDGKQIVNAITVERMTTQKSQISRRGLGFDKPEFDPRWRTKRNPCSLKCPATVYGHTGYSGTCFWIDPTNKMIYIFLCNRINPVRWNTLLGEEDIRQHIQTLIYEAIK